MSDPDYVKFLEYLQNEEAEETQTIDAYLEELENKEKDMKGQFKLIAIFAIIFFTYFPRKSNLEKFLFIQTNSIIIFTCPNPVLRVPAL